MKQRSYFPETLEARSAPPASLEDRLDRFIEHVSSVVQDLHNFVWDEYRKHKLDVDEKAFVASGTSAQLKRSCDNRVRFEHILVCTPGQPPTITIGSTRSYTLAAGFTDLPGPFIVDPNDDIIVTVPSATSIMVEAMGVMIPNPARGLL